MPSHLRPTTHWRSICCKTPINLPMLRQGTIKCLGCDTLYLYDKIDEFVYWADADEWTRLFDIMEP